MGRVKSKYPKGSFVFKLRKPNAQGEKALYLQYIVNTPPVFITMGIFLKDADWDSKSQTVKSKNPAAARLNNQLKPQRGRVDEQIDGQSIHLHLGLDRRADAAICGNVLGGEIQSHL